MRKLFATLLIFIYIFGFNVLDIQAATVKPDSIITKIENDIYGFDYSNDSAQSRVARLEKTVYGKSSSGDVNKRIKKLSDDISADVIGLEIEPTEDTFREEETVADSSVNYPIVDEIEQKIFNQTYKKRDLHSRIVAIERKIFGKIYDVDDYSTRMERIKSKVMPETIATKNYDDSFSNQSYYDDNALTSSDLSGIGRNRFKMPFGQKNYSRPYANYGDMTGGSAMLPNNPNLNDELSQLEYETFGTEFSNENTATRIKRLNSVSKAKKSTSKYDSNKFSQRMSTAMEIGAMILMILAMVL